MITSKFLINIPERKITQALQNTIKQCPECSVKATTLNNCCEKCRLINKVLKRYADANIPVLYWKLEMSKFQGEQTLKDSYDNAVSNLANVYDFGYYVCFAGNHGVGKTMTCCNILKRALEKGYDGLYITLSDIVDNVISNSGEDKIAARHVLLKVDFLVIDEFDSRYIATDSAADLYGRVLENIFRTRVQNKLPTIMCTNSPNMVETFSGTIKQSISSLMNYVVTIPVVGKDFRKQGL